MPPLEELLEELLLLEDPELLELLEEPPELLEDELLEDELLDEPEPLELVVPELEFPLPQAASTRAVVIISASRMTNIQCLPVSTWY